MVNILDVFYALISEFKKVMPTAKHYVGNIPESFISPCFLYLLAHSKDDRTSYFAKDTSLDIQIIYFGLNDKYGKADLEDKLKTMSQLKQFLSQFNINVKDRNLKFSYSFGEADEQVTINMQFKFKDDVINLEYDELQTRDMVESIFINEKEVI